MAPVLELDKQTVSFNRQLEDQRKLEKNLLVERVRGTKEGTESAFADIKNRVALLEKLNGTASAGNITPVGWSKLACFGSESVSDSDTIDLGNRNESFFKPAQICHPEETYHIQLSSNPYYAEHVLPSKSSQARVGANPSLWDTLGYIHIGYGSALSVPAAQERTTVLIVSQLHTLFHWIEANAIGDEWYAQVVATARLWVTYDDELLQAPPVPLVNLLASPTQMRTHQDLASQTPSAALALPVPTLPGRETHLSIYESIELVAATPNGHAYLDGVFSWEPLAIQLRAE